MKLHELNIKSQRRRLRVGRGIGSGHGKTAGRGTKGQKSRSGGKLPLYFEGGQNPLVHRIPKQKGFTSIRLPLQIIHTGQLNQFKTNQVVTLADLKQAGLIKNLTQPVKLLSRGQLTKSLKLEIHLASRSAQSMIKANKGELVKPSLPIKKTVAQ